MKVLLIVWGIFLGLISFPLIIFILWQTDRLTLGRGFLIFITKMLRRGKN